MLINPNTLIPIGTECIATTTDKKGGVIKTECIVLGYDLRDDTNMPYYVCAENTVGKNCPPDWNIFDPTITHGGRVSKYITGDLQAAEAKEYLTRDNNWKFTTWLFRSQIEISELELEQILNILEDECSSK